MSIFNSYVSLPEGIFLLFVHYWNHTSPISDILRGNFVGLGRSLIFRSFAYWLCKTGTLICQPTRSRTSKATAVVTKSCTYIHTYIYTYQLLTKLWTSSDSWDNPSMDISHYILMKSATQRTWTVLKTLWCPFVLPSSERISLFMDCDHPQ